MNEIEHFPLMFLIRWQIVWHVLVYICWCQSGEGGYTHSFFVLAVLLCYFVKLLKGIQLYKLYRLHKKLSWMTEYNIASSFSRLMQQHIIALHKCHCARKNDRVMRSFKFSWILWNLQLYETWHCNTTKHIWTENSWIMLTTCNKRAWGSIVVKALSY